MRIFWTQKAWESALAEKMEAAHRAGMGIGRQQAEIALLQDAQTPRDLLKAQCLDAYAIAPTHEVGEMLRFLMSKDWDTLNAKVQIYKAMHDHVVRENLFRS